MELPLIKSLVFGGTIIPTILVAIIVNRLFLRRIKKSTDELINDRINYQFLRPVMMVLIYIVGIEIPLQHRKLMTNCDALSL